MNGTFRKEIHLGPLAKTVSELNIDWFHISIILLSGDVERNPGPETLNFCTWILNNSVAHDFM